MGLERGDRDHPFAPPSASVRGRGGIKTPSDRPSRSLFLAIAAGGLPIVIAGGMYGLWLLAWWELGHPPRPSIDDPKQIHGLRLWYYPILLLLAFVPLAMAASALAWVGIAWEEVRPGGSGRGLRVLFPLLAWIGFLALLRHDPGQVLVWIGD